MNRLIVGLVLFFNALLGILFYHAASPSFLIITTLMAFVSSVIVLYHNRANFVYFYRMLIIVWVGMVPALAVLQGGYFALRMPYVQTQEVGWVFSILVCTTLLSAQLGFWFADKTKIKVKVNHVDFYNSNKVLFWVLFFLILIVGFLISLQRGDIVFYSSYGSGQENKTDVFVQNLQSIVGILFGMLFLILARIKHSNISLNVLTLFRDPYLFVFIFALFYVVIWAQFLRGARMDPVGIFIVLFVLFYSVKRKIASLTIKWILIALLLIFLLHIWGGARSSLSLASGYSFNDLIIRFFESDAGNVDGVAVMYFQGTFNNISIGVAGVIHAIQNSLSDLWYGKSYIDFIARIPPASIYPDRPESLAFFSSWIYTDSSGGGMNEMGEIYLNFGIYGSLLVPGIISFIIGWSYKRHRMNPTNLWVSLPFIAIISVYTRGLLYQTFDGFKAWITALILYGALYFFYHFVLSAGFSYQKKPHKITTWI